MRYNISSSSFLRQDAAAYMLLCSATVEPDILAHKKRFVSQIDDCDIYQQQLLYIYLYPIWILLNYISLSYCQVLCDYILQQRMGNPVAWKDRPIRTYKFIERFLLLVKWSCGMIQPREGEFYQNDRFNKEYIWILFGPWHNTTCIMYKHFKRRLDQALSQ